MWAFPGYNGTVVVGCDSSGESQNAVVEATQEASRRGTKLVLLSVAEHRPYWPDSLAWVARAEAESAQQAQAAADCAMASALATDRSVAVRIAIVHEADSLELDDMARHTGLLVLGGRGDGGQLTFSVGSTSAELGRRSTVRSSWSTIRAGRLRDDSSGLSPSLSSVWTSPLLSMLSWRWPRPKRSSGACRWSWCTRSHAGRTPIAPRSARDGASVERR